MKFPEFFRLQLINTFPYKFVTNKNYVYIRFIESCALPSTILDVYTVGDLLNNGGDDSLAAQSMVDDGELLPNTEARALRDSFCMFC